MSINAKNILRLEFFLTIIWILQSDFLLGVYQMIFIYARKCKIPAEHVILICSKNDTLWNLRGSHNTKLLQLDQQHEVPKFQSSLIYYAIHEIIVEFFYRFVKR